MKKESLNEELKNLSPLLLEQKRQGDGFRVPEGYFEGLEDAIFNKLEAMDGQRRPFHPAPKSGGALRSRFFGWSYVMIAAAAVFVLILAAKWLMTPKAVPASTGGNVAAQQMTEEALIEAYVLENIRDFEAEQLAALSDANSAADPTALPEKQPEAGNSMDHLTPEELELLLREMSDEELESLL